MLHGAEIGEDIEVEHIVAGRLPVKKEVGCTFAVAETRTRYGAE
jgi:hypothetical protein